MRINFRQGLVAFQKETGSPTFLQASSTNGMVSHVVQPTPTIAAFAEGHSDYLQKFDTTTTNAWGPVTAGVNNYLYWDIDRLTGQVSHGITKLIPVVSLVPPSSPAHDQHWFDQTTTTMKVWNALSTKWQSKIRLFAGYVTNGNTNQIVMYSEGSQVGLTGSLSNVGFIVTDTQLQPLRKSSGEFLTDASAVHVRSTVGTAGVLIQPVSRVVPVRAAENMPAMSLVYFSDEDTVRLASSNPSLLPARVPVGVMLDALASGDIGTLTSFGELTYDQWNWTGHIGEALYCDDTGQFTLDRPVGLLAYRVGFVKNKNSVMFQVDAETNPQIYTADVNSLLIAGSSPVTIHDVVNGLGERVVTIGVPVATTIAPGLVTPVQAQQLIDNVTAIANLTTAVSALELSKSDVGHTHIIEDTTGLQVALDAKFPLDGNFDSRYALIDHNHDLVYSQIGHVHQIADVSSLQETLNTKAYRVHANSFDEVFQGVNRTTSVDQGVGLSLVQVLASKANTVHTHIISDVANLQAELDNKAPVVHGHSISDVTGLQNELDNRAYIQHTQDISTINGLVSALAGKAALVHTHAISDVNGLESAIANLESELLGKAAIDHTHFLSGLHDVSIPTPVTGQFLSFNGTVWIASAAPGKTGTNTYQFNA